jgi:hypothetical protein
MCVASWSGPSNDLLNVSNQDEWQKENLLPKVLPELLARKVIKPNRVKLIAEGSFESRVATGLDLLRHNKVSGEKVVIKVGESDA